jgi:hypothetical protein
MLDVPDNPASAFSEMNRRPCKTPKHRFGRIPPSQRVLDCLW